MRDHAAPGNVLPDSGNQEADADQRARGVADRMDSEPQFLRLRRPDDGLRRWLAPRSPADSRRRRIRAAGDERAGNLGRWGLPLKMIDGVPTETPPHVAAAITAFATGGVGLILFSQRMKADPRWRDLATCTLSTGITILALFVTLGFFAIDDGAPLHPWAGLLQRVLCAVWFTCTIVLAVRLHRLI